MAPRHAITRAAINDALTAVNGDFLQSLLLLRSAATAKLVLCAEARQNPGSPDFLPSPSFASPSKL
jgi:hypothetical protein